MAKARTKDSVKIRAIKAWAKAKGLDKVEGPDKIVECWKARAKQTVTVREAGATEVMVWSYAGGNLRRLSPSQAAGAKGLSACISGEYA